MIASTCLVVVFVPSFYVVMQRIEEWRSGKPNQRAKAAEAAPAADARWLACGALAAAALCAEAEGLVFAPRGVLKRGAAFGLHQEENCYGLSSCVLGDRDVFGSCPAPAFAEITAPDDDAKR